MQLKCVMALAALQQGSQLAPRKTCALTNNFNADQLSLTACCLSESQQLHSSLSAGVAGQSSCQESGFSDAC